MYITSQFADIAASLLALVVSPRYQPTPHTPAPNFLGPPWTLPRHQDCQAYQYHQAHHLNTYSMLLIVYFPYKILTAYLQDSKVNDQCEHYVLLSKTSSTSVVAAVG